MIEIFGVYSTVRGPDGNGLLSPTDPALGGLGGTASTTNNTPVKASGGFVPEDQKCTVIYATVQAKVGSPPTAAWSARIKGTFTRNGNTVTQIGGGVSTEVESSSSLASIKAAWGVDSTVVPNQIVPTMKGAAATAIDWQWSSLAPTTL